MMKRDTRVRWRRVDPSSLDLRLLKVAVIGGTGGIGRAIGRTVASRGGEVLVVGRTFRDAGVPRIGFLEADLSSMAEARRVSGSIPAETLDLVILTTGIFAAPKRQVTAEGIERDMAVSYLSRLVIVRSVARRLGTRRPDGSRRPRVFIMGFPGTGWVGTHDDLNSDSSYRAMKVHMNTVAGNEALVLHAARRYPQIDVYGLNPGFLKTNIRENYLGANSLRSRLAEAMIGLFAPSATAYAKRITPLLVSPDIEGRSGTMFNRKGTAILPSAGLHDAYVDAFIAESEALVARAGVRLPPRENKPRARFLVPD